MQTGGAEKRESLLVEKRGMKRQSRIPRSAELMAERTMILFL